MPRSGAETTPPSAPDAGCAGPIRRACTVLDVLSRVDGKWALGILSVVTRAPARFAALEREIRGVSRRMLTRTLRDLEREGLLTRTVFPTVPPGVEYAATDKGRDLYEALLPLTDWAHRHAAPERPEET